MWNPNTRSKTKVPILKLAGLLTLAAVFLLFPVLSGNVEAGSYKRPTPGSRPTEKVVPATLRHATETVQYTVPSGGTQNVGSFNVGGTTPIFDVRIVSTSSLAVLAVLPSVPMSTWVDASTLRFSQTGAGGYGDAVLLRESMAKYGWKGNAIRAVRMPEGIVVYDNTRLAVALEMGMTQVPVQIYELDAVLPDQFLNNVWWKSQGVHTWRDVMMFRTSENGLPLYGTATLPKLSSSLPTAERAAEFWREANALPERPFGVPFVSMPLTTAEVSPSILAQTDMLLARRLAPVIEKISSVTSKLLEPIETIGAALASRFPDAAARGASFMKALVPFAKAGGVGLGALGVIFGLMNLGMSGPRLFELIEEQGLGVLGTREGVVAVMHTLADALETLAGGAAIAAIVSSETVVGGIGFGAAALILAVASFALKGTAWAVENWDAIVNTAKDVWEGAKDGAIKAYRWVADSASAAGAWAGEQVNKLVTKTKNVLAATGQLAGELVRGAVQVTEQVVEQVTVMVSKIVEYVEDKVTNVVRTGVRMVEKMVEEVREILEPIVRIGERMVERMVDVARQVPRIIYETATRFVDRTVQVTRQVTEWVTTRVEEAYQYATQVTRNVTEWVTERVQEAYEVVRQVSRQITEWITERVQEAYTVARQVARAVTEWITERVREAYTVARQVARTVWDTVTTWVSRQVRRWFGWFWRLVTESFPMVTQVARTVWDTVYETAYRWVDRARQVTRTVYDTVYETAYRWVNRSRQVTRTVYDTVRETLYRLVERPVQRVRQIVETVWRTGTRLVDRIVPVVRSVTDWVTTRVEETYQVVRTVYDTVVERVPQLVRETYEYIEQVPHTIVTQVQKLVPEQYQYTEQVVEHIAKTRIEVVPEVRQVERMVTKTVEGWIPKAP